MRRPPLRACLAGVTALSASQLGHLLSYQLRYGGQAWQRQSSGVHSYFPSSLAAVVCLAGAAALATLFLIGLARLLSGRGAGRRMVRERSLWESLPLLFALQLGSFMAQEVLESTLAGQVPASAPELLLWGALGQLPAALVAAALQALLGTRLETALHQLSLGLRVLERAPLVFALEPVRSWTAPAHWELLARCGGPLPARRGPPANLLAPQ